MAAPATTATGSRDVLINFRTTEATREILHRAAEADGLTLSAWLRRLAIERAKKLDRGDAGMIGARSDPVPAFRAEMEAAGLPAPTEIVPDGQLHRFRVEGDKRGSKNGWYVLYPDEPPAGAFGCWKRGVDVTWCAKAERDFTAEERSAWRRRMAEAKAAWEGTRTR
ncbi:MAG: plasmid mobilization protein [Candidatus Longimicrobiales bacterium M2_2A_002]